MSKSVRLRNATTIFVDPETGFCLSGADNLPLPKKLGRYTKERIQAGAILVEDIPDEDEVVIEKPVASPAPVDIQEEPVPAAVIEEKIETEEKPTEGQSTGRFYTAEEIEKMDYFTVLAMASALGLRYGRSKPKLAQLRIAFLERQEYIRKLL